MTKDKLLTGWISIKHSQDRSLVEDLGVKLGKYDEVMNEYEATVMESNLEKLEPYWNRFWWAFHPVDRGICD